MPNDRPDRAIDPTADLRADLTGAIGLQAWGAGLGVGSSFALNLGQPNLSRPRWGQWRLRVSRTAWRIETPTSVLTASEYSHGEIDAAVTTLDGKVLVDADVELPSLSAVFSFADGTQVKTFSVDADGDHWRLFRPDGLVRIAGPDGFWVLRSSDSPSTDRRRR